MFSTVGLTGKRPLRTIRGREFNRVGTARCQHHWARNVHFIPLKKTCIWKNGNAANTVIRIRLGDRTACQHDGTAVVNESPLERSSGNRRRMNMKPREIMRAAWRNSFAHRRPRSNSKNHALRRIGAADEALEVLSRVNEREFPEVILQKANCHSSLWRYREAVPLLRSFLMRVAPHLYSSKVAKINLLAALIFLGDSEGVERLIADLHQHLSPTETPLLYGNYLELNSSWKIQCRLFYEALTLLDEAHRLLAKAEGTWDALLVEKGIAIAQSARAGKVLPGLHEIKGRAIANGQWEVNRDCDFHIALIERDLPLFEKLYFGTPYQSYRQRIQKIMTTIGLDTEFTSRTQFQWPPNANQKNILDLKDGALNGKPLDLKLGQAHHKLLLVLASDFYKPFPIANIFSQLHPGEYYYPIHSPNRVHQAIARFRRWCATESLPLAIEEHRGSYQLQVTSASFSLLLLQSTPDLEAEAIQLERVAKVFQTTFTTQEISEFLHNSPASSRRLVRWGVLSGKIEAIGKGKRRKYRFVA